MLGIFQDRFPRTMGVELTCPFCSLGMPDLGLMTLHIDRIHSEPAPVDLPGLVLDDNGVEIFSGEVGPLIEDATITFDAKADYDNEDDQWVECPQAGCAEAVLLSDLVDHLDFHDAEAACLEDSKASRSNSNSPPQSNTSVSLPLCSLKKDTNPPQLRDSVRSTQAQGPSRVSKRGRSIESDSSAQNHIDSRSKRSPNERDSPIAKVRRHGRTTRQSTNGSTSFVYLDESDKPAPTGDKLIGYFPSTPQHDRVPQRARRERRHDGVKLKRLGRSELGPYHGEEQMPDVLRQLHEQGGDKVHRTILAPDGALMHISGIENEVEWLLPAIATLCERDSQLAQVYLCHPAAKHVFKLPKEGNFCGYRNIQMLVSYIISAPAEGQQHFDSRIPHVLQIQDQIEAGWTMGINSFCRTETGGIKGTRKYIGTSEAQTYFTSLGIPSKVEAFSAMPPIPAHEFLFESIRAYFMADDGQGTAHGTQAVVRKTYKPPVYFQHHGHSMTIIGYEKRKDNSQCLLVFDPSCRTVKAMTDLVNTGQFRGSASTLLRLYRRGVSYLRKHDEFEILMLAPSPQSDANDHSGSAES